MNFKILVVLGILMSISFNMSGTDVYSERIILNDGSEICGYVGKDNLSNGEIEIMADWSITSVPAKDVTVKREISEKYRLDSSTKEWLQDHYGECPGQICFANITMEGDFCNPKYLLYDQMLSGDTQSYDKILLEDGDILKYVDFTPRKFKLNWGNVARIDRNIYDHDLGFTETIIPFDGDPEDGIIESQVLRHHRVLKREDGKRITYLPKSIRSILKKASPSDVSLFDSSPLIESLELEDGAGTEKMEGIIIENNRENKYFILLTNSGYKDNSDNPVAQKVKYADVKAISYRRNSR